MSSRKLLEIGGVLTAVVLVAFGVAAIIIGSNGRNTVVDELKQQMITGTPDMTPTAITEEVKKAGIDPAKLAAPIPSCSVAGQKVDSGTHARCFAQYMNIHALLATGNLVYAQMPHYATADGKGTNDPTQALQKDGKPVDNPARDVWINETALSTALNTSYMADQTALFGIVVGIALLLAGVGFGILALGGALRNRESAPKVPKAAEAPAAPAAGA
jgi:hypothetical protein